MYRKHALDMRYRVNWGQLRRPVSLGPWTTAIVTVLAIAGAGLFYLYWFQMS
jgi:hypothetical protein